MNFPMDNPFFQFAYWLVNTPTLGGIAIGMIALVSLAVYALMLRWVLGSDEQDPREPVYAYPTPALHHSSEAEK